MISVDQEPKSCPLQMDLILPEETTEPEKYLAWIHRAFCMFNPVKKFVPMSPLSASDCSMPLLSASDCSIPLLSASDCLIPLLSASDCSIPLLKASECSRILPSTLILPKKTWCWMVT